mgnify:CR=1 FL=1
MPIQSGVVKRWLSEKKFGFIIPDIGGDDVFLHVSQLHRANIEVAAINKGVKLQYDVEPNPNGKGSRAVNVVVLN